MLTPDELFNWLRLANQRYSQEGVPHKGRPFKAMSDLTRELGVTLSFDHPIAKRIFDWFQEISPPGAHEVGSAFTGAYFFDTAFWAVHVPFIFGRVAIEPLECMSDMPAAIRKAVEESPVELDGYLRHWLNCMDYGYGRMDLADSTTISPRAASFLSAAHSELVGANAQILETRPNVKAILGMRMATEIYLKTVLVQELNLNDSQLMKLGHKLEDVADACSKATNDNTFDGIGSRTSIYPSVSARYDAPAWTSEDVWEAARLTQPATVTRRYSDRNMLASVASTTSSRL